MKKSGFKVNTLFQEDIGIEEKGQVLRHEKDE